MWFIDTHMQVTLEKIAVLDPVFDTFDAVGAFDEVGDPASAEETLLVRMHASILWILCISISTCVYLYIYIYIYIYIHATSMCVCVCVCV